MTNDISHRINIKSDNGAYINLGAFIVFGVVQVFNIIPLILLIGVIVISIYNITFNSFTLIQCIKNRELLGKFNKQRNTALRIIVLAICLIAIAIVKMTTL